MKVRFYFNDFTLYADIEWNFPVLPQKGELVFLEGLVSLQRESSNVFCLEKLETQSGYICVSVYNSIDRTKECTNMIKDSNAAIITTGPMWRQINGEIMPMFRVKLSKETKVIDAYNKIEMEVQDF